ncbi:hypothetical protein [Pandoraea commovens]|uniref:Uncharacterized protein n=1 Tax=Pandoraea commovens TaxID=2508289 RepID=A0ABY5Q9Z1_9BURK|nr:hypothetical protein [Pandoraea commovens]UVA77133.1 hypothetical protein NTU39_00315 [Pandoraea commovens]
MTIFQNDAATAILREAAEKLKAIGLHAEIGVNGLPHGDALVLFASDTKEGVEAGHVALWEGAVVANTEGERFASEMASHRTTRVADRLMHLHHTLEERGDRGLDWSQARALEDRFGAGQLISGDEDEAERLLSKYGY